MENTTTSNITIKTAEHDTQKISFEITDPENILTFLAKNGVRKFEKLSGYWNGNLIHAYGSDECLIYSKKIGRHTQYYKLNSEKNEDEIKLLLVDNGILHQRLLGNLLFRTDCDKKIHCFDLETKNFVSFGQKLDCNASLDRIELLQNRLVFAINNVLYRVKMEDIKKSVGSVEMETFYVDFKEIYSIGASKRFIYYIVGKVIRKIDPFAENPNVCTIFNFDSENANQTNLKHWPILICSVSDDDRFVYTQLEGIHEVWSLESGKMLYQYPEEMHFTKLISFIPNTQKILVTLPDNVFIIDLETRK